MNTNLYAQLSTAAHLLFEHNLITFDDFQMVTMKLLGMTEHVDKPSK